MDTNWEAYRIKSREKPYYNASKGGKQILRDERQHIEDASTQNPSIAMI